MTIVTFPYGGIRELGIAGSHTKKESLLCSYLTIRRLQMLFKEEKRFLQPTQSKENRPVLTSINKNN